MEAAAAVIIIQSGVFWLSSVPFTLELKIKLLAPISFGISFNKVIFWLSPKLIITEPKVIFNWVMLWIFINDVKSINSWSLSKSLIVISIVLRFIIVYLSYPAPPVRITGSEQSTIKSSFAGVPK